MTKKRSTMKAKVNSSVDEDDIDSVRFSSPRSQAVARALSGEYFALLRGREPQKRGRQFETLISKLFYFYNFTVERSTPIAPGRQVDLTATSATTRWLIEAKWQDPVIGTPDVDNLVARLDRAPRGALGCFISMSPYASEALARIVEVRRSESKGHSIVVIDRDDVSHLLSGRIELIPLLETRLEELQLWNTAGRRASSRKPTRHGVSLPGADALALNKSMPLASRVYDTVFIDLYQDIDEGGGVTYSLDLPIFVSTHDEFRHVFEQVHTSLALRPGGGFSVTQLEPGMSWFGSGVEDLLRTLQTLPDRYRAAKIAEPHHSEEFTLVSPFESGWLAVTGRQHVASRKLTAIHLEVRLPSLPIDMASLAALTKRLGFRTPGLTASPKPLTRRANTSVTIATPIDYLMVGPPRRKMINASIVTNPYAGRDDLVPNDEIPWRLRETSFLVGRLPDWLALNERVHRFRVLSFEFIEFRRALAVHVTLDHGREDRFLVNQGA